MSPQLSHAVVSPLSFPLICPESECVLNPTPYAVQLPTQLAGAVSLFVRLREPPPHEPHFGCIYRLSDNGVLTRKSNKNSHLQQSASGY